MDKYFDVWILATDAYDGKLLENLAEPEFGKKSKDTIRCCWKGGLGHDISKVVTGFGRVIKYGATMVNGVPVVDYPSEMWEGKIKKGYPYGFGRYINCYNDEKFIGYLSGTELT